MTAGMREGEKNSGQHPMWEKIPPLPGPASLHLEPAKRVTGSSQPAVWQGLTPPTPVPLSNFHLSLFCAGSGDKKQLSPRRVGQRTQKELGKAMAASACYHCLWARAEHLQEPQEWNATAHPWFNVATSKELVSHLLWMGSLSTVLMPSPLYVLSAFLAHPISFQGRKEKHDRGRY